MLIRNTCCLQRGNVTSFRGYLRHPVVLPEKIDLRMQITCKVLVSIGLYSLSFGSLKKASFLENRVCKKGQVKVTLFPGIVFQERILF